MLLSAQKSTTSENRVKEEISIGSALQRSRIKNRLRGSRSAENFIIDFRQTRESHPRTLPVLAPAPAWFLWIRRKRNFIYPAHLFVSIIFCPRSKEQHNNIMSRAWLFQWWWCQFRGAVICIRQDWNIGHHLSSRKKKNDNCCVESETSCRT